MKSVDVLAWLDAEIWARESARSSGAHAAGYTDAKEARAAVAGVFTAGNRVIAAFTAVGNSKAAVVPVGLRIECEDAMAELDDALKAVQP